MLVTCRQKFALLEMLSVRLLLRMHLTRRYCAQRQSSVPENDFLDKKIIYNSAWQSKKTSRFWYDVRVKAKIQKRVEKKCDVEPVTLQYLDEYVEHNTTIEPEEVCVKDEPPFVLPYSIIRKINVDEDQNLTEDQDCEVNYDREY